MEQGEKIWSEQQEGIFKWFEKDKGALVIRARAGTGKTTTVLEGVNRAPEDSIVMCAFNKSVATELSEKIRNPYAEAKTLHGLGFACVRRFWDKVRVANGDERVMTHAQKAGGWQAPDQMLRMIAKLAQKGKEMAPLAKEPDELMELAYDFDCVPDEEWDKDGWDVERVAQCAFKVMELACQRDGSCDFSDMLYLPIRNRWVRGRYGLVVVDECFPADTPVLMADGSSKPIECIVAGDSVLSYDEATGQQMPQRVSHYHRIPRCKPMIRLTVRQIGYGSKGQQHAPTRG